MSEKTNGRRRGSAVLQWQNLLLFGVIIVVFLGSTLLFWRFHTKALRSSIEAETTLTTALLADDLEAQVPLETILSGEADARLLQAMERLEDKLEGEFDVWLLYGGDAVYYRSGSAVAAWEADQLTEAAEQGFSLRWLGDPGWFLLHQSCCVVRPLWGGSLLLVAVNQANAARALQRQQFTLVMVIEGMLMLVMLVLVVNSFAKYRRQLIRYATTDELTGLANRKSFQAEFAEMVGAEKRPPFSLFLLDIDYFKQINDNYGHAAGDQALRVLARHIRAMVEEAGGFAGRWGGDEFIGVLPLEGDRAFEAVRDLCGRIAAAEPAEGLHMTISAGVVFAEGETRLPRLSEKADRALYESKANGRRQATLYRPERAEEPAAPERPTPRLPQPARSPAAEGEAPIPAPARLPFRRRFAGYVREKLISSTILGVRWMAPFVAGGGILIALAFLFDAAAVNLSSLSVAERAGFGSITSQAATLKTIGGITFNFMLPVFAGFMAYGIAGEPAFMTGFVGGYMTINSNAGFIGAMVAGFAAGVITNEALQFTGRLPNWFRKAAPILIFPVFNLLLMQVLSYLVITPLSAAIGSLFSSLLHTAEAAGKVPAGALASMMMAVDMGGIINKVAYNYGVDGLLVGSTDMMAAVMIGGMVPPIGIALSCLLYRSRWRAAEHERAPGALFMGLSFITEGALPFVFTDPGRVIPSCMLGSALAGILSVLFGCTLPAPHGGLFVIPLIEHPLLYLLALALGALVTAVTLGQWKRERE